MPTTINLPTVKVTARICDQSGKPVGAAEVRMRLSTVERYGGYIVPREVTAITDGNGVAVLDVFPNALGSEGSEYVVRISFPNGQMRTIHANAVVPNSACNLQDIMELPASTPRDTGAVITAEVAGYASAAASSADAARSYRDAASAVEIRVNASEAAASASKVAALEAALLAEDGATRAGNLAQDIQSTVDNFQSAVVGQIGSITNQLTAQATGAIAEAKAVAIEAVDAKGRVELTEFVSVTTAAKATALTEISSAGATAVSSVNAAGSAAIEEFKDLGDLYEADFQDLTEKAQAAAGQAACSAKAAEQCAEKACACADTALDALSDFERALAEAAARLVLDEVITAASQLATEQAGQYAADAQASAASANSSEQNAASAASAANTAKAAAEAAIAELNDLSFVAKPLAPGSAPTVAYDRPTRVVTLGLAPGAKGDKGQDATVTLSDAVNSTSSTTAASSKAVKTAHDTATAAQTTASGASSAAGAAQTTANSAQTSATAAQTTANTALTTANSAQTAASTAQTTANGAQTAAGAAQTTANSALTKANAALPATGTAVAAKKLEQTDITGQTVNLNGFIYPEGYTEGVWICRNGVGSANITPLPLAGDAFRLELQLLRRNSNTDYIHRMILSYGSTTGPVYERLCVSGVWSEWKLLNQNAFPMPKTGAGVGQLVVLVLEANQRVTLPPGGTWEWLIVDMNHSQGISVGVDAGGTVVFETTWGGFVEGSIGAARRIA